MSDKALSSLEGARCEMMSLASLVNWNTSSHNTFTNTTTAYCYIYCDIYIYIIYKLYIPHWFMVTVGFTVTTLFTFYFKRKNNQNELKI